MRRSPLLPLTSAAAAGVVVGASGPLLLGKGGPVGEVAHLTLSAGWSWAALSFFAGMAGKSKAQSAALGVIPLIFAVVAYYLTKASQGDFLQADLSDHTGRTMHTAWGDFLSMTAVWCFFACILGPALGIAGHLSRNGPYRLPFRLLVPLVAIVETSMRLGNEAPLQGGFVAATWSVTRVLMVVAVIALVGEAAFSKWRTRSVEQVRP